MKASSGLSLAYSDLQLVKFSEPGLALDFLLNPPFDFVLGRNPARAFHFAVDYEGGGGENFMLHDLFYVRDLLDVGGDVELDQGAHRPLVYFVAARAARP